MIRNVLFAGTLQLDAMLGRLPSIGRFRPLKGTFSALERLKKGEISGRMLWQGQEAGFCPPGSITEAAGMSQHDHQPWPAFWTRSDDARLVGSMLHWRDSRDLLCSEGVFGMTRRRRMSEDRFFAQILVPDPVPLPGAWTSIASNWADGRNYFHWITDGLSRLLVRETLPEETRILLPARTPSYIKETLEILGLDGLARTAPGACVQPERYYFCSPTAMAGVWNPAGFNWLRGKFSVARKEHGSGSPIFLTRRGTTRLPPNLGAIEAFFAKEGFQIVDCGRMNVREQIALASGATAIAGIHGAAMTNILWAHAGTPVLELFLPGYLNACYEQIAFQGKLHYTGLLLGQTDESSRLGGWVRGAMGTRV